MRTALALALLGVVNVLGMRNPSRGVGDLRTTLQKDLQNVIDHATITENAGRTMINSASRIKLQRQELCWKLAADKVMATALPETNSLTHVYNYIDGIGKKLSTATDEEINGLWYEVLDGDNSTITWTLNTANTLMTSANNLVKGLSLDLTC